MASPRFTFCIPNLNKIDFLPACIESVLAQDSDDWCCVFVDGFSTDGCWEYMQRFADDPRFRLMRGLKQGMYADWNYCLEQVETEYFYILTSDDTCYPELVSTTVEVLDRVADVEVCHFQYVLTDKDGEILYSPEEYVESRFPIYSEVNKFMHRRAGLSEVLMHYVYGTIYMTITSLVFRSSILSKMHGFSSDYGPVGDYDWSMRLGLCSDILYIPKLLATWRTYTEQATALSDGLKAADDYVKIGKKNLPSLKRTMNSRNPQITLDERRILSKNADKYVHELVLSTFSSSDLLSFCSNLSKVFLQSPTYFSRKLFRRLRFKPYKAVLTESAYQIISQHELSWPPENIVTSPLSRQLAKSC